MSNKKSKGALLRRIGAQASAGLILVSATTPILETLAYAETTKSQASSTSTGGTSNTLVSSSLEEVPQPTIDTSSGNVIESSSSSQQSSESQPPVSSSSKPVESTSSTNSSGTKPSTSSSKPGTSTTSNSTVKPGSSSSKPSTSSSNNSSSSSSSSSNKEQTDKEILNEGSITYSKNQSTQEFINQIGPQASRIGEKNDIYASVMIAQAILESASGNSTLARDPNFNLFGIKGSYKGKSVGMPTLEDNGKGKMYSITANFRKYPSYKESLEDYALLIKGGTNSTSSFYQGTWKSKTKSYRDATTYLTGRYATDSRYNQKLNSLIETYDLQQFDEVKKVKKRVKVTRHKVAEGESLWDVSKHYGTTINRLKELNKMSEDEFLLKANTTIVVRRELVEEITDKKKLSTDKKVQEKTDRLAASKRKKATDKELVTKEAKEVALLKVSQLGHAMKNAVPSALFEAKTLKVAGKQVKTDKTHYVTKGENISDIADKVGIPVEQLVKWNNLEDTILTEGQILVTTSPYITYI